MLKTIHESVRRLLDDSADAPFVAGEYARRYAGKSIRKGLKRLLDEAPGLADPEQHERHHAMRIAAKRLRYTIELARPVYAADSSAGDLSQFVDAVKRLQTLLGEIHDCDVWIETFAEFAHKEKGEIELYFGNSQRFERLRPGFDYLEQERKDRRSRAFGELVSFWKELLDQGAWDRLAATSQGRGQQVKSQEKLAEPRAAEVAPVG